MADTRCGKQAVLLRGERLNLAVIGWFMWVSVGSDVYGKVKTVGDLPIVTRFSTFNHLPIRPIESMYFLGMGKTEVHGIPFVATSSTTQIHGVPLNKIDRQSVRMGYLRALFAVPGILGAVVTIFAIFMLLTEKKRMDTFNKVFTGVGFGCALVGGIGGGLTYVSGRVGEREKRIRTCCGELLGLCIDPAAVRGMMSLHIEQFLSDHEFLGPAGGEEGPRVACLRELVLTRAKVARNLDDGRAEEVTDQLLDRLAALRDVAVGLPTPVQRAIPAAAPRPKQSQSPTGARPAPPRPGIH